MKRYAFSGKVLPERANVEIKPTIVLDLRGEDIEFEGKAYISISWSQISIALDVEVETDIFTMKNSMEHTIRVLIDSYGYISGRGYDIEITSVVDPNNVQTVFGVSVPELENKEHERPLPFKEIFEFAMQSKELQYALFNLRESIRSPLDTGFFCYRAIEAVRQYFKEDTNGKNDIESWTRFRSSLRLSRSYFTEIEVFAIPQRHGSMQNMTGEERVQLMKKAWIVVDRFALYLKLNKQPLGDDLEFLY